MNITIVNNTGTTIALNGKLVPADQSDFLVVNSRTIVLNEPVQGLKEEDIIALGWKHTPDITDYAPSWTSYIYENAKDISYYELSNEDNDNVWGIQECDKVGNYIQEGENMFFVLKNKKDLEDLMRLMGLN